MLEIRKLTKDEVEHINDFHQMSRKDLNNIIEINQKIKVKEIEINIPVPRSKKWYNLNNVDMPATDKEKRFLLLAIEKNVVDYSKPKLWEI